MHIPICQNDLVESLGIIDDTIEDLVYQKYLEERRGATGETEVEVYVGKSISQCL